MIDGPKLLVEWSSPWQEFRTAIRPALRRSPAALAGEAPIGLFPLRGILVSWGAEAILLALAIILPAKLAMLQPFRAPTIPKQHEVIYYGPELPQVQDLGGAQMGKSGRAGGDEAFHKTQTLKVARGSSTSPKVVDAPDLRLPVSPFPVANLLAVKPIPGPPPAEGLKTSTPPVFSKNTIIAPPPETIRQLSPPPHLAGNVVPPPASAAADRRRQVMGLSTVIVAPAPNDIPRDHAQALVSMNSPIVQPAPNDVQRQAPPLRGPAASNSSVVPPPVSAPLRDGAQAARLNMPAPAVIVPPPSQVTNDRSVTGASLSDPKVVPPPVQLGGRSQDPRAIVGMSASTQIVPPPPSVTPGSALNGGGVGHNQRAGGVGTVLSADNVVPPPPSFGTDGNGRGQGNARGGASGASLGSADVVPPPPSLGETADRLSGHGSGARGGGLGGPLDAGSVLAPPSPAGGTGSGKGVIVSSEPGSALGRPGNGSAGSIAMSPSGNAKSGMGGSGGGAGIGHGNGPGSGLTGEGSGAAKTGTGKGSDPNSHGGISPYPGTGGAGIGTTGQPPAPGVSISGGSTAAIVNLPSFGSDGNDPSVPGRSPTAGPRRPFSATVKGTSRSGGAFNMYGHLPGIVYTTSFYVTGAGSVSMEFSDPASVKAGYSEELTSPDVLQATFPIQLNGARIMLEGKMNPAGHLHDFHPIFSDPGAPVSKVVAALARWKFTPALRGNDPVEVSVLLGFNIDTR